MHEITSTFKHFAKTRKEMIFGIKMTAKISQPFPCHLRGSCQPQFAAHFLLLLNGARLPFKSVTFCRKSCFGVESIVRFVQELILMTVLRDNEPYYVIYCFREKYVDDLSQSMVFFQ